MDLRQVEAALESALLLTQRLAPFGALAGPVGAEVGATVGRLAGLGAVLLQEVTSDATIIASGDLSRIRGLQSKLQAENDLLSAAVDDS